MTKHIQTIERKTWNKDAKQSLTLYGRNVLWNRERPNSNWMTWSKINQISWQVHSTEWKQQQKPIFAVVTKIVHAGKFIALNGYVSKERFQINDVAFYSKNLEKIMKSSTKHTGKMNNK